MEQLVEFSCSFTPRKRGLRMIGYEFLAQLQSNCPLISSSLTHTLKKSINLNQLNYSTIKNEINSLSLLGCWRSPPIINYSAIKENKVCFLYGGSSGMRGPLKAAQRERRRQPNNSSILCLASQHRPAKKEN